MKRTWTVLLLLIGVIASSPAAAQRSQGCNLDRIRAQFESSESFPNLVGCRPDDVRPILQNQDYGLRIENQVASDTVRAGRIVSQRRGDGNVYVDVSSGPPPRQRDERVDQFGSAVGQIIAGALEDAANSPRDRPLPRPDPYRPDPPAPHPALVSVLTTPVVAPPVVQAPPPVVQPPPPPPVVQPPPAVVQRPPPPPVVRPTPSPAPTPARAPPAQRVALASPPTPPVRPPAEPEPAPPETILPLPPAADLPVQPPAALPPPDPPPPVTRFFIHGTPSAEEGRDLVLTIRREGRDGADHRIALSFSDPALLVSPPRTFNFRASMPDEVALRIRTAAVADGDRRLIVRLASTGQAEVGQPGSMMAMILDREAWWEKLLRAVASLPIWAAGLAAAALAAGLGTMFLPRASCSIENGGVNLGAGPLKRRWPAVHVDTAIGDPSFSIPSPLPLGRRTDAEPSPA